MAATSFAPKDFGTGRWDGGPATITNPRFEYRRFTPQVGTNAGQEVKNVTFYLEFLDAEGNVHKAQYDVGNAAYCQIKESNDDDADEAEVGPAIASPDPKRPYRLYPDSDFAKFTASLVSAGFSEAKLSDGDITVIDGVEVNVYKQPRKEGDKFPLLLINEVTAKGGGAKAAKAGAKGAKAEKGAGASDVTEAATAVVATALTEADGEAVPVATLVKKAMAMYKGQDIRAAVVKTLGDATFLGGGDDWVYDEDDKTVTAV